jgi:U6 snRNA-associated Sm-like protein LSm4
VELKGGDTYNGRLVSCDAFMNMNLREVICTSKDGDRFWKLEGCYIRGSAIKYLRLLPAVLEKAAEEEQAESRARSEYQPRGGRGRGGRGGRDLRGGGGRGRGRGGRGGRDAGRGRGRGRTASS